MHKINHTQADQQNRLFNNLLVKGTKENREEVPAIYCIARENPQSGRALQQLKGKKPFNNHPRNINQKATTKKDSDKISTTNIIS
jgi:hypothetical protein